MNIDQHQPPVLRPAAAAKALGVSVDTLKRWEAAGRVQALRTLGGHRRYAVDEIERIRLEGAAK